MYSDNIFQYVATGSIFHEDEKRYMKHCWGPALLTFMFGILPGNVLKGHWAYMSIAMIFISLACVFIVFKLSLSGLTLANALCLDAVIFGTWILDLSILELMLFIMWKGFTPLFLLIYLPIVIIPLFIGFKTYNALKNDNYCTTKTAKNNIGSVGFISGILGMNFAAIFFKNVEQGTAIVIVLICLSFVNAVMSLGLLSLQKLYYLKKYKPFG